MEVPPGAVSYPFHFHCANEEAIYVVSGRGIVRIGEARVPVRAGDWIAFPVGPDHAHQMINDGTEALVYLAVGTEHKCDVLGYPDSNKISAMGGASWEDPWIRQIVRRSESLDYWDGEPDAGGKGRNHAEDADHVGKTAFNARGARVERAPRRDPRPPPLSSYARDGGLRQAPGYAAQFRATEVSGCAVTC